MKNKLNSILLVDDDDATNFINQMVVEKSKVTDHIETVLNGRDAIYYLSNQGRYESKGSAYPKPSLILLDINMPIMDGWEFLETFQKLEEDKKGQVVIIMLSTSFNPDDQIRASKISDISGFKQKPLTLSMLDDIMKEYF